MPNITNITPPRVPLVDVNTGYISREWYRFFLNLFTLTGGGSSDVTITDLLLTPTDNSSDLTERVAELLKQIEGLETQPNLQLGTMAALQQDNLPWVQFDTTPQGQPTGPTAAGTLYWDDADGVKTLNLVMEDSGGVIQQIGEETYYRVKASSAITNGQVVMFTGAVGASGAFTAAPATGLTPTQSEYIMGVATQDIAHNAWGYVTWFGVVRGINTTGGAEAWVDGQVLYYNPAVPGGLTKTIPTAPNPKVIVAAVIRAASNGSLFVRPTFGSALGETDSNVQVTTPTNGDLLIYDQVQARWENAKLTAGANVTITNGAGSITIDATSGTGTVTSVALAAPTGFTVSGSPVTTSGTLTLSFTAGYSLPTTASQTNWDTAYTDRLKWDGGATGLVAATGRTSLGATAVGTGFFTMLNPSAISYPRINADNTVTPLVLSSYLTELNVPYRANFTSGAPYSVGAADIRNITNPTTGLGYSSGVRFRFSSLNDDSASPYADVIDLSTFGGSSGGGFNALYFGKNSQLIQHKYAAAGATSWTVKTVAYTDSNITGNAANVTGVVAAANGGTGQSSYAVGDLLYADTTTSLAKLADVATGNALISGGVGVAPSWGKIGLTTHVSGTLAVGSGGTGLASWTANGVIYASGTTTLTNGTAVTYDGTTFKVTSKGAYLDPVLTTGGFNILATYAYNDNLANTIGGSGTYSSAHHIIYISSTAGLTSIPVYCNGGAGVNFAYVYLDPDAGTWAFSAASPTITFTQNGTGGNTFSLQLVSGNGSATIQRTAGTLAYTVYVQRLAK